MSMIEKMNKTPQPFQRTPNAGFKPGFQETNRLGVDRPQGDRTAFSSEAKKKPLSAERNELITGLKSNFGGNDRISTADRTLERLSDDQLKSVKKKREFDKALTEHEEAHYEVAADLARSKPMYEMETGEDGVEYRKSGKVMIDTGTEKDDSKTVKKMQQVRAAALAPDGNQLAPLSEQDKKVAQEATEKEQKAQARLNGSGDRNQVANDGAEAKVSTS